MAIPYSDAERREVLSAFAIDAVVHTGPFEDCGNINRDTYAVVAERGGVRGEYLLQRLNTDVFGFPDRVMGAMAAWSDAQRAARAAGRGGESRWEVPDLVPVRDPGACGPYALDAVRSRGREVWRLMQRVPRSRAFKSLVNVGSRAEQLRAAVALGEGLARAHALAAELEAKALRTPLPGYRHTPGYGDQLRAAAEGHLEPAYLPDEPERAAATRPFHAVAVPPEEAARRRTEPAVIEMLAEAAEGRSRAESIFLEVAAGQLPLTPSHGDTKIENFLFDAETGRVIALVDLDTVMGYTWLTDYGDLVRSLANVAGERTYDLDAVTVDEDVVAAVDEGFMAAAGAAFRGREAEVARRHEAVETVIYELGIRFLADYLRGDNYFRLGPKDPPDLNLQRARVQFRLRREWRRRRA